MKHASSSSLLQKRLFRPPKQTYMLRFYQMTLRVFVRLCKKQTNFMALTLAYLLLFTKQTKLLLLRNIIKNDYIIHFHCHQFKCKMANFKTYCKYN